uniref:EF-hand domain-containing protein n=1 Tax=Steinernema glaseri TaxID=37863 RepID=A0A1I7ZPL3_9BILA
MRTLRDGHCSLVSGVEDKGFPVSLGLYFGTFLIFTHLHQRPHVGDGKIVLDELKAAIKKKEDEKINREMDISKRYFKGFDANKNGLLELEEVENFLETQLALKANGSLADTVKPFDKNADGKLDLNEFNDFTMHLPRERFTDIHVRTWDEFYGPRFNRDLFTEHSLEPLQSSLLERTFLVPGSGFANVFLLHYPATVVNNSVVILCASASSVVDYSDSSLAFIQRFSDWPKNLQSQNNKSRCDIRMKVTLNAVL